MRFSQKLSYKDNGLRIAQIIGAADYPLNQTSLEFFQSTTAWAPIVIDSSDGMKNMGELIELIGGMPSHAPSVDFWMRLEEVVDIQLLRRKRGDDLAREVIPWFPLPLLWQDHTMNEVAETVHKDFPGSLHIDLLQQFFAEGLSIDYDIIPKGTTEKYYVNPLFFIADVNSWASLIAHTINFGAKYYAGRARPEVRVNFATTLCFFNTCCVN